MMTMLAALVAMMSFAIAFRLLKVWPVVAEVIIVTRGAAAVIADSVLDDDVKEREIRRAAKRLMGRFVEITVRVAIVLAVPAVALLGFEALDLVPFEEVVGFLLRGDVILASIIVLVALCVLRR